MKKIHNANSCGDEIFASCMCFSTFWKKCKNAFLLLLFLKQALWTWKYVQKKLVIGPDFHQKFYQNRVISQKYTMLQKVYIFNSTSRYPILEKIQYFDSSIRLAIDRIFENRYRDISNGISYDHQTSNTSNSDFMTFSTWTICYFTSF